MSNIVTVHAVTVVQTDYSANIDKFYTTYVLGKYEIRQWGRVGVIGQFSIQQHLNNNAAEASAQQQIRAKQSKGYTDGAGFVDFQFDLDKLGSNPGKDQAKWVAHAKDAAAANGAIKLPLNSDKPKTSAPLPGVRTIQTDRFEDFTSRALAAITQAVTDPSKAGVTYAKLNEEWVELQTVTEKAQSYLSTLDSLLNASMS